MRRRSNTPSRYDLPAGIGVGDAGSDQRTTGVLAPMVSERRLTDCP